MFKKMAKALIQVIVVLAILYLGIFILWVGMFLACTEQYNGCGSDSLSQMVRKTHLPLLKIIAPSNNEN